jgi:hypothetical protein
MRARQVSGGSAASGSSIAAGAIQARRGSSVHACASSVHGAPGPRQSSLRHHQPRQWADETPAIGAAAPAASG